MGSEGHNKEGRSNQGDVNQWRIYQSCVMLITIVNIMDFIAIATLPFYVRIGGKSLI